MLIGMSPGAKLTIFMLVLIAVFFAIKSLLARVLGPYPEPSKDRPPSGPNGARYDARTGSSD